MRSRVHYWSNSKLAGWIRGTPKPSAATLEEWDEWHARAKRHKVRYWIAEEFLNHVQDMVSMPSDILYGIKYRINNRFVTRSHTLTSTLPRWKWYDLDHRILHCMFDELVNFVEVEQAWWNIAWDKDARKKYNAPRYAWGWFRWRTWRCPEAGIDALKWASDLKWDPDGKTEDDVDSSKLLPTPQAVAAKEILELYNWWKVVRPARVDPYEQSGWAAHVADKGLSASLSKLDQDHGRTALDKLDEIEKQYDNEDDEMLIRLIRVRHHLWT